MINSEPGPHGFLLKESRDLSVREAQRRIVPLWGEIAVLYHDGEPVTHDGLIELHRTASAPLRPRTAHFPALWASV